MTNVKIIDFLRGWAAAAVAYIVGQLATHALLPALLNAPTTALEDGAFSPWIAPAVIAVLAAVVAVRRKVTAAWWKWLLVTMVVPTIGGAVMLHWATTSRFDVIAVLPSVLGHVALAGVLGVTAGSVLNAVRRAARRPR